MTNLQAKPQSGTQHSTVIPRPSTDRRLLGTVLKALTRRTFATLATSSPAQRAHAAAVLYQAVDLTFYITTSRSSRKARNIAANPRVAMCVPVRRLPIGPAAAVQFQATADILGPDDPEIQRLLGEGKLKTITSHGELDDPDTCVLRIRPARRIHTYGIGMSLLQVLRDPLNANRTVELPA